MRTLVEFYRKYFRKSFFNKILFTYSIITVFSLLLLTQIIMLNFGRVLEDKELKLNSNMIQQVSKLFYEKYRTSINIYQQMYLKRSYDMENLVSFFEHSSDTGEESYFRATTNFDSFLASCFKQDPDLLNILVRKNNGETNYISERVKPLMRELNWSDVNLSLDSISAPNEFRVLAAHISGYVKQSNTQTMVYTFAANVMGSGSNITNKIGEIYIDFDAASIQKAYQEYIKDMKGYILILRKSGDVVFDSSNRYYGTKYPYFHLLDSSAKEIRLEKDSIVNLVFPGEPDVIIAGIIPKDEIFTSINTIKRTVYLISFLCILTSVLLSYINTFFFSKRVRTITDAMKKLRNGDLSSRIPVGNTEDEISDIAISYNQMCSDLQNYINKVYISEIKQKAAQLSALQFQVNPHFLYNTLEAIRMRSITSGNEDAGDMIHLLAVMFRNSIKDEMIIEIKDELKYCNLYLELFKIRYYDRLSVEYDIDERITGYGILKHLLQPVIENYIMHGFDSGREDNLIQIRGYLSGKDIIFEIKDNGTGIGEEKLKEIRESLNRMDAASGRIGLTNVNERIRLIFGESYGLDISSEHGYGTTVTLRIQAKTKKELKRYVQDIHS